MPVASESRRLSQVVAQTVSCQVGRFRAPADSDLFRSVEPPGHTAIVFPRTSVAITPARGRRFVTDTARVVFHNRDSFYRREVVDPRGDDCVWMWASDDLIGEIVDVVTGGEGHDGFFSFNWGPCPSLVFLKERSLWRDIRIARDRGDSLDSLELDESVVGLISLAVEAAAEARGSLANNSRSGSASRFLAWRAVDFLASHFCEAPGLERIALAVGCSKYHLCRVFRQHVGTSLHQHRLELQLRAAYDLVSDGHPDLAGLAGELGFSSHSHLTEHFGRRFGVLPSAVRDSVLN